MDQGAFRDCATAARPVRPVRPVRSVRFPGLRRTDRRERNRSRSMAIGRATNLHIDADFQGQLWRPAAEGRRQESRAATQSQEGHAEGDRGRAGAQSFLGGRSRRRF